MRAYTQGKSHARASALAASKVKEREFLRPASSFFSGRAPPSLRRSSFSALPVLSSVSTQGHTTLSTVVALRTLIGVRYFAARNLVKEMPMGKHQYLYILTVPGAERVADLEQVVNAESDQAFVAMWIHNSTTDAWKKGIKPAIKAAGYTAVHFDARQINHIGWEEGKEEELQIRLMERITALMGDGLRKG